MQRKEDESEWSLEKIYNIKNKKELEFIKRLDEFKKTDIDINKKLDGLINQWKNGVGLGMAKYANKLIIKENNKFNSLSPSKRNAKGN